MLSETATGAKDVHGLSTLLNARCVRSQADPWAPRTEVPAVALFEAVGKLTWLFVEFRAAQVSHAIEAGFGCAAGALVEIDGVGEAVWHGLLTASVRRGHGGPYGGQAYLEIAAYDDGFGVYQRINEVPDEVSGLEAPIVLTAITERIDQTLAGVRAMHPRVAIRKSSSVLWLVDATPVHCKVGMCAGVAGGRPYLLLCNEQSGSSCPRYPTSL